jgi:hypothetical protein
MEVRQVFSGGREEGTDDKRDYLWQRRKLNPEVFKYLNRQYPGDFYRGEEVEMREGHVVLAMEGSVYPADSGRRRKEKGPLITQH